MRLRPGGLHVPHPSPRSRAYTNVQHGQWWSVRSGLSRQLYGLTSQQFDLCPHGTPLVEPAPQQELPSRHLRLKPPARIRTDS